MPRYTVIVHETIRTTYEVVAQTLEEAEEVVTQACIDDAPSVPDCCVTGQKVERDVYAVPLRLPTVVKAPARR